jgi:hypothetical protein
MIAHEESVRMDRIEDKTLTVNGYIRKNIGPCESMIRGSLQTPTGKDGKDN